MIPTRWRLLLGANEVYTLYVQSVLEKRVRPYPSYLALCLRIHPPPDKPREFREISASFEQKTCRIHVNSASFGLWAHHHTANISDNLPVVSGTYLYLQDILWLDIQYLYPFSNTDCIPATSSELQITWITCLLFLLRLYTLAKKGLQGSGEHPLTGLQHYVLLELKREIILEIAQIVY